MSQGRRSMPVLAVKDVLESAGFFNTLGFALAGHWNNDDGVASFAIMVMDTITVALTLDANAAGSGENWVSYFYVDDIAAFLDDIEGKGISPARGLTDQPYGCRDIEIIDLDGNRMCFGQDLSPTDAGPGL